MIKIQEIYLKILKKIISPSYRATITPEAVIWGYRLFLDREPENQAVVADKSKRLVNSRELRQELVNSEEFRQKNHGFPTVLVSGNEPPMYIEETATDLQGLFSHIQRVWEHFSETEPYWSVLTQDRFKCHSIQGGKDDFYRSGHNDVVIFFRTLDRNGIDYTSFKTCLEWGCGLGRVTRWLAERFETVFGYDISKSHLQLAENYFTGMDIRNVSLRHISKLQDIENIPKVDVVYSIIVLQHNPPPIIDLIIQRMLKSLNPGGVAFFQVPTYRYGYKFSLQEYLSNEATKCEIEMHVLPQSNIFNIAIKEGCRLVEILEDGWTGLKHGERSNTFVIQKD